VRQAIEITSARSSALLLLTYAMADDAVARVASLGDVLLRRADVALLSSPRAWLNDAAIAFSFEALRARVLGDDARVLLVPGATTFLLIQSGARRPPAPQMRSCHGLPFSPPPSRACRPRPGSGGARAAALRRARARSLRGQRQPRRRGRERRLALVAARLPPRKSKVAPL
jgi:hypothetical protein